MERRRVRWIVVLAGERQSGDDGGARTFQIRSDPVSEEGNMRRGPSRMVLAALILTTGVASAQ